MKTMFRVFSAALALLLLLTGSAGAANILPVLQTPLPEIAETISLHEVLGLSAPVPEAETRGSYQYFTYTYHHITIADYELFGRALSQEGFALNTGSVSGTDVSAEASRGSGSITVSYNIPGKKMSVVYSPTLQVRAWDISKDAPYRMLRDSQSILPAIPEAVSLDSATALSYQSDEETEDGGRRYHYSSVNYDCYNAFGIALGEAGYALVSAETLEDGSSRAIVKNGGGLTLTMDYNLETQKASVVYPAGVYPREPRLYEDYETVRDGEAFSQMQNVVFTPAGWKQVDSYKTYYSTVESKDGRQSILVTFEIRNDRQEELYSQDLLSGLTLVVGNMKRNAVAGMWGGVGQIWNKEKDTTHGPYTGMFRVGFQLTEKQLEHPEDIALIFNAMDGTVRRVYFLAEQE